MKVKMSLLNLNAWLDVGVFLRLMIAFSVQAGFCESALPESSDLVYYFETEQLERVINDDLRFLRTIVKSDWDAFESVLKYYEARQDPRRLFAARYLLSGVVGQVARERTPIEEALEAAFVLAESIPIDGLANDWPKKDKRFEEIDNEFARIDSELGGVASRVTYKPAYRLLDAAYLIRQIESAFKDWDASPWKDQVDLYTFCEYVLPYRLARESIEDWREVVWSKREPCASALFGVTDPRIAFEVICRLVSERFLTPGWKNGAPKFSQYNLDECYSNLDRLLGGRCWDEAYYRVFNLRGRVIPSSVTFIPAWGNRSYAVHAWGALRMASDERKILYKNANSRVNTNHILDASYIYEEPVDDGLFSETITYNKFVPKVYEKSYRISETARKLGVVGLKLHPDFRDMRWRDVTERYVETIDIRRRIGGAWNGRACYLCVFDAKMGWVPVAVAKANGDQVHFENVGPNILYAVCSFDGAVMNCIGNPFLPKETDVVEFDEGDGSLVTLELTRKYPLGANTAYRLQELLGCQFAFAQNESIDGVKEVFEIKSVPLKPVTLDVNSAVDFRVFRFASLAEIKFFGESRELRYGVDFIVRGGIGSEVKRLFDSDYNSYVRFGDSLSEGAVARELVVEVISSVGIRRVEYCPRSDTNFIEPGDEYCLMYWKNGWNTLFRQVAVDFTIKFEGVPSGGLYWLRDLTKGKEERPFVIQNGRQVFL